MSAFEKIIPGAFLVCVALTACNGDRRDSLAHNAHHEPKASVDTVTQPNNMPAPATVPDEVPQDMQGKDSRSTAPLAPLSKEKESSAMPEALHGNNHGSDSVGTNSNPNPNASSRETTPLKRSSLLMPKSPKVIWV